MHVNGGDADQIVVCRTKFPNAEHTRIAGTAIYANLIKSSSEEELERA